MGSGKHPTAEHRAILAGLRDKWRRVALCTQPADRAAAERAVSGLYERAGVPRPPLVWFDSPLQAAVALAYLTAAGAGRWDEARGHLGDETALALAALVAGRVGSADQRLEGRLLRKGPATAMQAGPSTTRRLRLWATHELDEWSWELRRTRAGLVGFLNVLIQRRLPDQLAAPVQHWLGRSLDPANAATIAARLDFDTRALALPDREPHPMVGLARNAGWSWLYEDLAVLSDRPEVLELEALGVPHAADGPALAWRDGWRAWAWHGVLVPREVVEDPEAITVEAIHAEPDLEVRRIMLERFGMERYLYAADVEVVHRDGYGVLYSAPVPGDEPVTMVEVTNATREPDGTFKRYLLRVPPTVRTAHEAVAWTFGERAGSYRPGIET